MSSWRRALAPVSRDTTRFMVIGLSVCVCWCKNNILKPQHAHSAYDAYNAYNAYRCLLVPTQNARQRIRVLGGGMNGIRGTIPFQNPVHQA